MKEDFSKFHKEHTIIVRVIVIIDLLLLIGIFVSWKIRKEKIDSGIFMIQLIVAEFVGIIAYSLSDKQIKITEILSQNSSKETMKTNFLSRQIDYKQQIYLNAVSMYLNHLDLVKYRQSNGLIADDKMLAKSQALHDDIIKTYENYIQSNINYSLFVLKKVDNEDWFYDEYLKEFKQTDNSI